MSIYPDTVTTCSACLSITNSSVEMFDSYTMNAYREVTGFEALSEHSLCYICRALVHKFFKFRRKCRQSYGELSRLQDYKYFKEIRNEFESHTGLLSNSTLQTLSTDEIDEEAPVLDSSRFLEKTTGIWCKNVLRIKEEIKDCIETEDIKMEQFDNVNDDFVCDEMKIDADFNDYSPMCVIPDLINPTKAKSKSKKRTKRKKLNGRRERDAKRRGRGDADEDGTLDELNMRLVTLSHDEQLAEIEDKKTSEAYSASEFKCEKCGSFFTYEGSFDSHTIRHDEAYGAHECPVCLVRFPSVRTLWSHRSNHRRRFECTACGRRIAQRRDCALHRAVCQKQPPPTAVAEKLTCDVCGKQSSSEYALKRHRSRSHFGEKKHQCHLCQKAFFNIQALRDHIVVHSGARPYVCENCGSGFPTRSRLQQHLVTHIASKHFYCAACDMTFPTERRLSTHLKVGAKHIKPEMLRHACDTCSRRFFTARALQLHVDRVHLKVQRYVCSECDRCYAAPNALILHLRKEHPESAPARKRPLLPERRRYVCDFCGDSFASRTILTCHMRRHTGERPLECPHCEARFAYPSARYTHIRLVHLKLKRNKTRKNPTATTRSDDAP